MWVLVLDSPLIDMGSFVIQRQRTMRRVSMVALTLCMACMVPGNAQAVDKVRVDGFDPTATSVNYSLKASDVALPNGVKPGHYQRVTRPYRHWTLICDENLEKGQRICNISQSFVDKNGRGVFSWTLAANQAGAPFLILRASKEGSAPGSVLLDLKDGGPEIKVAIAGCNESVCVGYQGVDDRIRRAIAAGYSVQVKFPRADPAMLVTIDAPLSGLDEALGGI